MSSPVVRFSPGRVSSHPLPPRRPLVGVSGLERVLHGAAGAQARLHLARDWSPFSHAPPPSVDPARTKTHPKVLLRGTLVGSPHTSGRIGGKERKPYRKSTSAWKVLSAPRGRPEGPPLQQVVPKASEAPGQRRQGHREVHVEQARLEVLEVRVERLRGRQGFRVHGAQPPSGRIDFLPPASALAPRGRS